MPDYYDACERMFSRSAVARIIMNHQLNPLAFFAEFGVHDEYLGQDLFDWLGY